MQIEGKRIDPTEAKSRKLQYFQYYTTVNIKSKFLS